MRQSSTTDKVQSVIRVGSNPDAIAIPFLYSDRIYVANNGDRTVSVIDYYTNTVQNVIHVDSLPDAIGIYDANNGFKVYVANHAGTVSVINGTYGTTNGKEVHNVHVGIFPQQIESNDDKGVVYVLNDNTVSVIKTSDDKVAVGITFNVSPGNSGNIVCNIYKGNSENMGPYPTNTYFYVESGTKCYAKPNKDFEFSSWVQNLGHNSTLTLNTTGITESPWISFLRLIGQGPPDPSTAFNVNGYGSFTAYFKPIPPAVPPEYWASLFTVVATALIGSLLIPAVFGWFKSKRQTSRLNSYHREINLFGKGNTEQLNKSYNMITNAYSEGKINNEQYTNLKTEISIQYEEIYKKGIDSSIGNGILLDRVNDDIEDAYAKGKLIEQHYRLLIAKQASADKLSSPASTSTAYGSPIKSY